MTEKANLHETKTMSEIIISQFIEHRMALAGLCMLAIFVAIALLAPVISWFTGISPDSQSVFNRYAPPLTSIELSRDQQDEMFETFSTSQPERTKKLVNQLASKGFLQKQNEQPSDDLLDYLDMRSENTLTQISSLDIPESQELLDVFSNFKTFHLLGTDELGRDVFMRLVYGTRISIGVGLLVALASAFIGILIGSFAGYYGSWIDATLMRVTDALLALPLLPLMIIFAAVDLQKLPMLNAFISGQNESIFKLVIILVLFSWMQAARLIRGNILSVREREYILAAKTLGAKDFSIIKTHVIPNVIAPLLVAVTLNVGNAILWEAALSFLGLGIQPPTPSWGNMLFNAQEIIQEAPLLAIMPGLLIFITVICFNFVGDGLQDAIDPKSIRR